MRKSYNLICLLFILSGCEQPVEKVRGIPSESRVKVETPDVKILENELKQKGYETFSYQDGDTTYLMQQYYLVFLKKGKNRDQDSLTVARLQEQHLHHLSRMYQEGFSSLAGPFAEDGEIGGIVVYNTATRKEADSLARLDPMVKAGRLEVEVHPWWAAKGGKLN